MAERLRSPSPRQVTQPFQKTADGGFGGPICSSVCVRRASRNVGIVRRPQLSRLSCIPSRIHFQRSVASGLGKLLPDRRLELLAPQNRLAKLYRHGGHVRQRSEARKHQYEILEMQPVQRELQTRGSDIAPLATIREQQKLIPQFRQSQRRSSRPIVDA